MPKSVFICQSCGAVHSKWSGKCSECGEWNTITEEREEGGLITKNINTEKVLNSYISRPTRDKICAQGI